jgi:hypothetical protein
MWQCCLMYLDDVIIFTKGGVARHVVELAAVLERLSRAGLSLKAPSAASALLGCSISDTSWTLTGSGPWTVWCPVLGSFQYRKMTKPSRGLFT